MDAEANPYRSLHFPRKYAALAAINASSLNPHQAALQTAEWTKLTLMFAASMAEESRLAAQQRMKEVLRTERQRQQQLLSELVQKYGVPDTEVNWLNESEEMLFD